MMLRFNEINIQFHYINTWTRNPMRSRISIQNSLNCHELSFLQSNSMILGNSIQKTPKLLDHPLCKPKFGGGGERYSICYVNPLCQPKSHAPGEQDQKPTQLL